MKSKSSAFFSGMGTGFAKGGKIGLGITLAACIGFGAFMVISAGTFAPALLATAFLQGIMTAVSAVALPAVATCAAVGAVWEGVDEYIDASETEHAKKAIKEIIETPLPEKPSKAKGVETEKEISKKPSLTEPPAPETPRPTPSPRTGPPQGRTPTVPSEGSNVPRPTPPAHSPRPTRSPSDHRPPTGPTSPPNEGIRYHENHRQNLTEKRQRQAAQQPDSQSQTFAGP